MLCASHTHDHVKKITVFLLAILEKMRYDKSNKAEHREVCARGIRAASPCALFCAENQSQKMTACPFGRADGTDLRELQKE